MHQQDEARPQLLHPPPCVYETVNPKAVSGDELYGYMTLSKDWKVRRALVCVRVCARACCLPVHIHVQTHTHTQMRYMQDGVLSIIMRGMSKNFADQVGGWVHWWV